MMTVIDGGLPQCRLNEGIRRLEISLILFQDIPISTGTRKEGRHERLRAIMLDYNTSRCDLWWKMLTADIPMH